MSAHRPNHVYENLNAKLRALVHGGTFAPGDKFLTERQVSEQFSISRPTANKALASLVSEGLLEFRKGIGTFVRAGVLDYDLRRLVSFTEKARAAGKVPRTEVRAFERPAGQVPAKVLEALRVKAAPRVAYMERVRFADELPVIFERRYALLSGCDGVEIDDLAGSLYQLWTERLRLEVAGAEEVIRAVNLNRSEAAVFGLPVRTACLQVIATGLLKDGSPLWWEDTLYRSDAYEFRNQLGGIPAGRPAVGRFTQD